MKRKSALKRETSETKIEASVDFDGGDIIIDSGIGFFDHMLNLLAKHSGMGINLKAKGDIYVDCHHTVEDTGIVLGQLLKDAVGNKESIKRYGHSVIPMDEVLTEVAIDFGGRGFFVVHGDIPVTKLGDFETETVIEFFRAVAFNAGMNLHIRIIYGSNTHHIIESIFKAFAHALKEAVQIDPYIQGVLSTKGTI